MPKRSKLESSNNHWNMAYGINKLSATLCNMYFPVSILLGMHSGNVLAQIEGFQATDGGNSAQTQTGQHAVITSGMKGSQRGSGTVTSMNIHRNESLTINQLNNQSHYLLKSTNVKADQILGTLNSNGKVTLYSGNGLYFGKSARVNVGSLIATGVDIDVKDFLAGKLEFYNKGGKAAGVVVNQGLIEAATGGSVTLMGGAVKNEGVIMAHSGQVSLVAGEKITMDFDGDGLIQFVIDKHVLKNAQHLDSAVENSGRIDAMGGAVLLSGRASKEVFTNVVNNSGVIKAGKIDKSGGTVRLVGLGAGDSVLNTGSIDVSSTTEGNSGGEIEIRAENITHSGQLLANSVGSTGGTIKIESQNTTVITEEALTRATSEVEAGGTIEILGDKVGLFDQAVVDASGATQGGVVLVGGDVMGQNPDVSNASITVVDEQVSVKADARIAGDGGTIVVFSEDSTQIAGTLSARGAEQTGDGGFIETSGKKAFAISQTPDVNAPNGNGGHWLIDPNNIEIVAGGGNTNINAADPFQSSDDTAQLGVDLITAALTGTNVVEIITTTSGSNAEEGDITLSTDLIYDDSGSQAGTLRLIAHDDIFINGDIQDTGGTKADDAINLTLEADSDDSGAGSITLNAANTIILNGGALNLIGNSFSLNGAIDLADGGSSNLTGNGDVFISRSRTGTDTFTVGTDISQASLNNLNGAGSITLGEATDGTGATVTMDTVAVQAINFESDHGSIIVKATNDIALSGNITTEGTSITFAAPTLLGANVSIDTTDAGDAAVATGQNIAFNSTLDADDSSTNDRTLTLNAGTAGTIVFTGAVGNETNGELAGLTITQSVGTTFTSTVDVTDTASGTIALTDTADGQPVLFSDTVTADIITSAANGSYNITFNGASNTIGTGTFSHNGVITFGNDNTDVITFTGGLDTTAASGVTAQGKIATVDAQMDLGDSDTALTLVDNLTLVSGSGAINLGAVTDGGSSFTLTLDDGSQTQTGKVTFEADATVNQLNTTADAYAIEFQGANSTIDTDTTFLNTGVITLGNDNTDAITFTGGLDTTAASVTNIQGTVATTANDMDLGDLILVDTTGLQSSGGNIDFEGSVDGTTDFAEDLTITAGAGDVSFKDFVGNTTDLGDITVVSSNDFIIDPSINGSSITIGRNESLSTDTFFAARLIATAADDIIIGGTGGTGGDVKLNGLAATDALDLESAGSGEAILLNANITVTNGDIKLETTTSSADIKVDHDALPNVGDYSANGNLIAEREIYAVNGDINTFTVGGGGDTDLKDDRSGGSASSPIDGKNTVLIAGGSGGVSAEGLDIENSLDDSLFPQIASSVVNLFYTGDLDIGGDASGAQVDPVNTTNSIDDITFGGLFGTIGTTLTISTDGDIVIDLTNTDVPSLTASAGATHLSLESTAGYITDNSDGLAFELGNDDTLTLSAALGIGIQNTDADSSGCGAATCTNAGGNTGGSLTIDVENLIINVPGDNDNSITVHITNEATVDTDAVGYSYAVNSAGATGDSEIASFILKQDSGDTLIDAINVDSLIAIQSAGEILENANDVAVDLSAAQIQLIANTGIATDSEIEINATDASNGLAVTTVTGDINILDTSGGLNLGSITGTDFDDAGSTTTDTTGITITTGSAGDAIRIRAESPLTINQAVSNSGGGDIILAAEGNTAADDLTINAAISTHTSGAGSISLFAGDSIALGAAGSVSANSTGTVLLSAGQDFNDGGTASNGNATGGISMADGSTIRSEDGDITLRAPGSIQIDSIDADSDTATTVGNVTIIADFDGVASGLSDTVGAVSEDADAGLDIIANSLTIDSAQGVGNAEAIETAVNSIDIDNSTSGNIELSNAQALTITKADQATDSDAADISITTTVGSITVGTIEAGTGIDGDVTLTSAGAIQGAGDDATADIIADVIDLTAAVGGIGTTTILDITANDFRADTDAGDDAHIIIDSIGTLGVGAVTAGSGDVTIDSTAAIDGVNDDGIADIAAATINLIAAVGGIGTTTVLDITAGSQLNADTVAGDDSHINIDSIGDVTIGLMDAGTGDVVLDSSGAIDSSNDDGTADVVGGAVSLIAAAGGIGTNATVEVTSTTLSADTDTGDDGNIVIDSIGDLTVDRIDAGAGTVTLIATGDIDSANDDGVADITGATINLTAAMGGIGTSTSNALDVTATTALNADTDAGDDADIFIDSIGALPIGLIDAGAGNVTLDSTGVITDSGNDTNLNINASNAVLDAVGAIGASGTGAIDTSLTDLNASTSAAGSIVIAETDGIILSDVDTSDGAITVTAAGAIAVQDVESVTNDDANDISITTTTGDIDITSLDVGGDLGDVILDTDNGAVDGVGAGTHITADRLDIDASTGIGAGVALNIAEVDELNADTTTGNIDINNDADSIIRIEMATDVGTIDYDHVKTNAGTSANIRLEKVKTNDGNISITNTGDTSSFIRILDKAVSADTTDDIVTMTTTGAILDAPTGGATDIEAFAVDLDAGTGLGSTNTLEIIASILDADVSGTGDIDISNTGALTLTSVSTQDGDIAISSTDTITVTSVISSTDDNANDITLTASSGNIELDSITTGTTAADVFLIATSGAIIDRLADTDIDITTQELTIDAATGVGSANALETSVVLFDVDNTISGNVDIDNTQAAAVTVTSLTTAGGGNLLFDNNGVGGVSVQTVTTIEDASPIDGEADVILTSSGGGDLDITGTVTAGTTEGDVLITVNDDGHFDMNASGSIVAGETVLINSQADALLHNITSNTLTVNVDTDNDGSHLLDLGDGTITINAGASTVNVTGGTDLNDTLRGPAASNTWVVTGANQGVLNPTGTDFVAFSNFATISGDNGINTDTLAQDNTDVDGAGGVDPAGAITVALSSTGSNDGFAGTITGIIDFDNIDVITNDESGNSLTGINATANWLLDGGATELYTSTNSLTFSNSFATLTGGTAADKFDIDADYNADLLGGAGVDEFEFSDSVTVTGIIDGGDGTDILDVQNVTAAVITVAGVGSTDGSQGDLAATTDPIDKGVASNDFDNIDTVEGGTGGFLTGPDLDTIWHITGSGSGTYGENGDETSFSNFTITGGNQADTFFFDGGTLTTINGGMLGEGNTIISNTIVGFGKEFTLTGDGQGQDNSAVSDMLTGGGNEFTNIDNLIGSGNADIFTVNDGVTWTGTLAGDAAVGTATAAADTILFNNTTDVTWVINGLGTRPEVYDSNDLSGTGTVVVSDYDAGDAATDGSSGSASGSGFLFIEMEILTSASGNDTFNIQSLDNDLTIHSGTGNDTFNISSNAPTNTGSLDAIQATLTLRDTGGTDTLNINDSGDPDPDTSGGLSDTEVTGILGTGAADHKIDYNDGGVSEIENLTIDLGAADDTFAITQVATSSTVVLNTNNGNDTVNIGGSANSLDTILGTLTVNGGDPSTSVGDTLIINDAGDSTGTIYAIDAGNVNRAGIIPIAHSNFEQLDLLTGSGNDAITVNGWASRVGNVTDAGPADTDSLTVNTAFSVAESFTISQIETLNNTGIDTLTVPTLTVSDADSIGTSGDPFDFNATTLITTGIGGTGGSFFDNQSSSTLNLDADTTSGSDFSLDNGGNNLLITGTQGLNNSTGNAEIINVGTVTQDIAVTLGTLYISSSGNITLTQTGNVINGMAFDTSNDNVNVVYQSTSIADFTTARGTNVGGIDTNGGTLTLVAESTTNGTILSSDSETNGGNINITGGIAVNNATLSAGSGNITHTQDDSVEQVQTTGTGLIIADALDVTARRISIDTDVNSITGADTLDDNNSFSVNNQSGNLTLNAITTADEAISISTDSGNIIIAGTLDIGANSVAIITTTTSGNINNGGGLIDGRSVILDAAGGIGISGGAVQTDTDQGGLFSFRTDGVGSAGNIAIAEANSFNTSDIDLDTDASGQTIRITTANTVVIDDADAGTSHAGLGQPDILILSGTIDTALVPGSNITTTNVGLTLDGNVDHTGITNIDTGNGAFNVGGNLTGTDNLQIDSDGTTISGNLIADNFTLNSTSTNSIAGDITLADNLDVNSTGATSFAGAITADDILLNGTTANFSANTIVRSRTNIINFTTVTGAGALQIRTDVDDVDGDNKVINITTSPTASADILDINANAFSGFNGELIIGGTVNDPTPNVLENNSTAGSIIVDADFIDIQSDFTVGGNLTLLADSINVAGTNDINAGTELVMVAQGSDPTAIPSGSDDGDITFGGTGGTPNIITATNTLLVAENTVNNLSGAQFQGDTLSVVVDDSQTDAVEDPAAGTTTTIVEPSAAILAAIQSALGFAVAVADITVPNPASALIGLQEIAFIDLGLFEEELTLFGVIGNGIALALEQCEEIEGCAVDPEEVKLIIVSLEARIAELELRLQDAKDAVAVTALEELVAGYKNELENFQSLLMQIEQYLAGAEEAAEDSFDEDFEDDFETDFEDDFAEEIPTGPADVNTVELYSRILETVNKRITWLESLKSDPEARARLSEQTDIDLTLENLQLIIDGSKQEAGFIENQIKLLLEGTEALLPKAQPKYSNHRERDDNLAINIETQILPIDTIDNGIGAAGVHQ